MFPSPHTLLLQFIKSAVYAVHSSRPVLKLFYGSNLILAFSVQSDTRYDCKPTTNFQFLSHSRTAVCLGPKKPPPPPHPQHHHHLLYTGYLHLYSSNKPCLYGIQCCNYSVVTIHGTYNAISNVKSIVPLHYYFPKYVCSAQYGCFL